MTLCMASPPERPPRGTRAAAEARESRKRASSIAKSFPLWCFRDANLNTPPLQQMRTSRFFFLLLLAVRPAPPDCNPRPYPRPKTPPTKRSLEAWKKGQEEPMGRGTEDGWKERSVLFSSAFSFAFVRRHSPLSLSFSIRRLFPPHGMDERPPMPPHPLPRNEMEKILQQPESQGKEEKGQRAENEIKGSFLSLRKRMGKEEREKGERRRFSGWVGGISRLP